MLRENILNYYENFRPSDRKGTEQKYSPERQFYLALKME